MTRRTSRSVLLFVSLLLVLCQTPAARAETPAETAAAFGLLGTWAVDCRLPPSLGNGYLTYAAPRAAISRTTVISARSATSAKLCAPP